MHHAWLRCLHVQSIPRLCLLLTKNMNQLSDSRLSGGTMLKHMC